MTTLFLARRWCNHGGHEAPAATFRCLPGGKIRRYVCESCYARIMEKRAEKRKEGYTA